MKVESQTVLQCNNSATDDQGRLGMDIGTDRRTWSRAREQCLIYIQTKDIDVLRTRPSDVRGSLVEV